MQNNQIKPDKITKPIQLLAAWLVGLILVNGSFLAAAQFISTPSWGPALLLIASVINVPIFILALFLLQTKFRPEMQADDYYSEHLRRKSDVYLKINNESSARSAEAIDELYEKLSKSNTETMKEDVENIVNDFKVNAFARIHKENEIFKKVFLIPNLDINKYVSKLPAYHIEQLDHEIQELLIDGLVEKTGDSLKVTDLGNRVMKQIRAMGYI